MARMVQTAPEYWLGEALGARTSEQRAKFASRGLSLSKVESETQTLLLRQLYLAHMDEGRFWDGRAVADQMIELGTMQDVALHDAARACLGAEDFAAATDYVRRACRTAPPSRRAFHLSCLGGILYARGQMAEAVHVLRRAVRWSTHRTTLYQAQLSIALFADGKQVDLSVALNALQRAKEPGRYGRFLIGELLFHLGEHEESRKQLGLFLESLQDQRPGVRAGLRAEALCARTRLRQLS
jgi:tetratricopeptide (TPR) repeat protein